MNPFQNCWDRVERAEAHSKTLSESWNSFLEKDAYSVESCVYSDGTGAIYVTAKYGLSFPTSFALQLGELLYQLRAALDGCVYTAAILDSWGKVPVNDHRLEFPICDSRSQFESNTRKIAPLSEQRRLLIEAVQPYNTPEIPAEFMIGNYNRSLLILNDWARKDRHRRLHIVGSWTSGATPKLRIPAGTRLAYMNAVSGAFLKDKCKIADFRIEGWKPSMNVQANPDLFIDVALDEPPPPCAANDTFGARITSMIHTVGVVIKGVENGVWPIHH